MQNKPRLASYEQNNKSMVETTIRTKTYPSNGVYSRYFMLNYHKTPDQILLCVTFLQERRTPFKITCFHKPQCKINSKLHTLEKRTQ